jgi:hypothetical protein
MAYLYRQMKSISTYRVVAVALVVVFGVFNIGIPLVIATCSMPEMMRGSSCPMCDDKDVLSGLRFTTAQNAVCCTRAIIAERNTIEFEQSRINLLDVSKMLLGVSNTAALSISSLSPPVSVVYQITSSPPAVIDIPIFISSLLI